MTISATHQIHRPDGRRVAVHDLTPDARAGAPVVLRYADASGDITERSVEPVALAATNGHWHLLAWCRLREGPRWFRTTRITSAHLTAEPAPEHDAATLFGTPPDDAGPVTLR